MSDHIHPNTIEKEFLDIAYNRFYDLYYEIMDDYFWDKEASYRLFREKEVFSVYFELLKYPPIQWIIENNNRPNFSDVAKDLMKFIRNVLFHFPFFDDWNDIWVRKSLVNLYSSKPQFIDKFLTKYAGHEEMKYRFWDEKNKLMTYISIKFPDDFSNNKKIYLKDILTEKDGVKFSLIFMHKILQTQVLPDR
ncbi:hypothetical protein JQN58_15550 [Aneurinibacillus sp. BA2021]|nr:hypothetical protein [Aneurinibacillus sp. BA2021]